VLERINVNPFGKIFQMIIMSCIFSVSELFFYVKLTYLINIDVFFYCCCNIPISAA